MRIVLASFLGACLLLGCATSGGESDFAWVASPGHGPDANVGLGLEQRILERENLKLDVVLGFSAHAFDEAPDGRDDGFDVRAGLRAAFPEGSLGDWEPWTGLGVVWLRARGEPSVLDEPGDYGGVAVALGMRRRLGGSWSIGPRFELLLLDAEGTGTSGQVPRVALDLVWHP